MFRVGKVSVASDNSNTIFFFFSNTIFMFIPWINMSFRFANLIILSTITSF